MNKVDWVWERGGAVVNHVFLTWPFAILSLSSSALELRVLFWTWYIPADRIVRLSRIRGWPYSGLQIHHTMEKVPTAPIFKTLNYPRLKVALTAMGYEIGESRYPG